MSHQHTAKERLIDAAYLLGGIVSVCVALKGLLVPNAALDGGVTGVSLLLHELFHWNLPLLLLIINIPFLVMGMKQIHWKFSLKILFSVALLALFLEFLPIEVLSHDRLIVSVFGGFFMGLGVGLSMRGGYALDGIEVLALYTLKRSSFTISEIILGLNAILFVIAGFFFGVELALYSMLTYFVASKTIGYVIGGIEEYTGVTIISSESESIKQKLVMELGKGISVYKGERGFLPENFHESNEVDIVFTIVTRLEVRRLRNAVKEIDPSAFVYTYSIKEASGGVLKKIAKH